MSNMEEMAMIQALLELAREPRMRREIWEMSLLYLGAIVVVVMSFPIIRYLA
jgi:hypothetical protein